MGAGELPQRLDRASSAPVAAGRSEDPVNRVKALAQRATKLNQRISQQETEKESGWGELGFDEALGSAAKLADTYTVHGCHALYTLTPPPL